FGADVAVHLQRVRRRQLPHGEADAVLALVPQKGRVVLRAELRPSDVLQANQRPLRRALQNDVIELARLAQAPHRTDADLILLARPRGPREAGEFDNIILKRTAEDRKSNRPNSSHRTNSNALLSLKRQ